MKTLIGIFICLVIVSGCSSDTSGRYQGTKLQGSYLDLNKDGTFLIVENEIRTAGKYEIAGDQIIMKFDNGMEGKYPFKDNKIIAGDRETYVKQLK